MIPIWKNKPVLPSKHALDEMYDCGLFLFDALEILEVGFNCSRSKREKNKYERCVQKGKKIIKVVAVDTGEHFIITHVGTFTASKKKLQQLKKR